MHKKHNYSIRFEMENGKFYLVDKTNGVKQ